MLIKCSECGKEISDKATICVNCGCPIVIEEPKIEEPIIEVEEDLNEEKTKLKRENIIWETMIVVFIIFIAYLFIKNSFGKPSNMSEKDYQLGLSMIETLDDYLDMNESEANTDETMDSLYSRVDDCLDISLTKYSLSSAFYEDDYDEIVNIRNEIASACNEKKR